MEKRNKKKLLWHNLLGITLFLLLLPIGWQKGAAQIAVSETLPGQVPITDTVQAQAMQSEDTESVESAKTLIGIEDICFAEEPQNVPAVSLSAQELSDMQNFEYLKKNYYIVDSRTMLLPEDINAKEALARDLTIDNSVEGPKVLIFHTHISERFADSDPTKGKEEGVWGAAEYLKQILEEKYGIEVLHHDGVYDVVDGKGQITGAYERMDAPIRQILKENPSIQVCIDMHRDGVAEGTRLVTNINGKDCAQIMFFNGLCRFNQDGKAVPTSGLENPYVADNLAFSLQMKAQANARFPGLTRKIYLNAYRFSLHFLPRATLIEVGAQTNTKEEVHNAMEPLAEILAAVLLGEE